MVSAIISRTVILLFGILYPAYASYKAVKTKNVKEYVKWMMYWIVFAFFTCLETLADVFVAWLPFYYELKILFVLWLLSPATKGSSILYRKFVHPQLAKREKEIDAYINKASDQGYAALLALGSRGFNYATNVVLNTAIKGQSKIADHLKKSYSLNDLSNDDDEQRLVRRESSISELDDETDNRSYEGCKDNRLLEESYQREMQELGVQDSVEEEAEDGDEGKIRRRRSTKSKEAELHPVDESEELDTTDGKPKSKKGPTYSHKESLSSLVTSKSSSKSSLSYSSSTPSSPSTYSSPPSWGRYQRSTSWSPSPSSLSHTSYQSPSSPSSPTTTSTSSSYTGASSLPSWRSRSSYSSYSGSSSSYRK